jgi:hypothetical protein
LEAAASESLLQVDPKLVKMAQPLLESRSDGIFGIEMFPDAMMVGGEVVVASFGTGGSAT